MGWEAIKRRPVASQCPTVPYTATPLDTCPDSRAGRADSQPFIYHSPDAQKRRHPVTFSKIPKGSILGPALGQSKFMQKASKTFITRRGIGAYVVPSIICQMKDFFVKSLHKMETPPCPFCQKFWEVPIYFFPPIS